MKRRLTIRLLVTICLIAGLAATAQAGKVTLTFDHFYDEAAVYDAFNSLNKAYPTFTELRSLGKSEEGRDIWLFTINNSKTGKDTDKPGVYVDGTIHGNEIQATEVCLYLAWYLLEKYDEIPAVKELVDSRVFYIIPIVNVDNRSHFFTDPNNYNQGRSARVAFDDDRDGLADEDGPDDLDGDGEILDMRIADPAGNWKTHPDDPRVMVRIKPGEKGQWRRLGDEGIDNDGDGRINEDPPGYLDMNRNYGFKWQPPYVQGGAGEYPMSAKPTKAVADFVITKPNICFNFAFHNSGGLWVRGPGSKLAGMYSPQDVRVYDYLGEEAEKIVPGYKYIIGGQDMYTTHGDFDEFMYSNLGIYGFVGELFMSRQERYRSEEEPGDEDEGGHSYYGGTPAEERQKFNDRVNQGTMFKDWTTFMHPQFGEIEIGGWRAYTTRIPPAFMLPEMVHRNASVVIFTAQQTPDVTLELLDVKALGGGVHRIRVRADNPHAMPTLSAIAMRRDLLRKDIFSISGSGIEVVSGGIIEDIHYDRVRFVEHRPWMIFTNVPSFGTRDIQWIVKGSGEVTISFDALKATDRKLTVKL